MAPFKDARPSPTSSTCSSATSSTDSVAASASASAPKSAEPKLVHLSPATEVAIRLLPGNDRCADCKAICPQWAGVSFGILLCLACAGKHRSLGVQTSFVKSLAMDSWSCSEHRALEVSGNAKWLAVCAGTGATDLPLAEKYSSGVAKAYKSSVLRAAADPVADNTFTATAFLSMLAGISSPLGRDEITPNPADAKQVAAPPRANQPSSRSDDGASVKCTTCRSMVAMDQLDAHSNSCSVNASRTVEWRKYERKLGVAGASLGFSLTKTNAGFAEVSRLIPDGEAERANVLVGSYLVGLNDVKHAKFDDIVNMLKTLPRPMLFHFVFRPHMAAVKPTTAVSSVPEPRTVEIEVTLQEKEELGCSLSATEFYCVVRSVDQDCIARRHGILVGSRVVAVNGRKYLKPKDLIREICTAQRPIQLKLHRVEGLMRGWNS